MSDEQKNSPFKNERLRIVLAEVEEVFPSHDFAIERALLLTGELTFDDLHRAVVRGIRAGAATIGYPPGLAWASCAQDAELDADNWLEQFQRARRGYGPTLTSKLIQIEERWPGFDFSPERAMLKDYTITYQKLQEACQRAVDAGAPEAPGQAVAISAAIRDGAADYVAGDDDDLEAEDEEEPEDEDPRQGPVEAMYRFEYLKHQNPRWVLAYSHTGDGYPTEAAAREAAAGFVEDGFEVRIVVYERRLLP